MSKFEYTDDMVARMNDVAASGVTEEVIEQLVDEFEYPRRSVTAKLRKLGYDVPRKPGAAPVFSAEETEALAKILEDNSGSQTADEIAAGFAEGYNQDVARKKELAADILASQTKYLMETGLLNIELKNYQYLQ